MCALNVEVNTVQKKYWQHLDRTENNKIPKTALPPGQNNSRKTQETIEAAKSAPAKER